MKVFPFRNAITSFFQICRLTVIGLIPSSSAASFTVYPIVSIWITFFLFNSTASSSSLQGAL